MFSFVLVVGVKGVLKENENTRWTWSRDHFVEEMLREILQVRFSCSRNMAKDPNAPSISNVELSMNNRGR